MKKIIIALSLIFPSAIVLSQAKVEIGLKAGANFSNTDISGINSDAITSFHGGAYGLLKFANIGIQPEFLYSSQGSEVSGLGDLDLNYISIPVLLKFYLPFGLNLQAGPQFGILTNAEGAGTDISDSFKNSDISAALGAGLDLPFGLQVSARYVLGLSDIDDGSDLILSDVRNNMFQLAVGYSLFKFGK